METPSSTRRVTRSQTLAAQNNINGSVPLARGIEDSEKAPSRSRQRTATKQQDRSALIDITNDSPIVGVAMGDLGTPSSVISKQRSSRAKNTQTPGSGETLLRGQVKTLLQKVEEEAELSKLSLEARPFLHLQGFVNSPMRLLAPTPANTPQILNLVEAGSVCNNGLPSINPSPLIEEQLISQVVNDIFDGKQQESVESEKNMITRSLLLDFSEKWEFSNSSECSSVVTGQGVLAEKSVSKGKSCPDDDNSSIWSIQVNASTHDDDEEQAEEVVEEYYSDNSYEDGEAEEDCAAGLLNQLYEDMSKISLNEEKIMPKFSGKLTRFLYNSDDEIVEEIDENKNSEGGVSPNVISLKGLPTPKGKHIAPSLDDFLLTHLN